MCGRDWVRLKAHKERLHNHKHGHAHAYPQQNVSFPEPANFACSSALERTGSNSPQIADLLYCITFQITNQDHLRIGPLQSLRFIEHALWGRDGMK